ncbi:MAG: hypothetical protein ABIO55_16325 [Ginsengibacter sp.]
MVTLEEHIKIINDKLQQLLRKNASLQKENEMLSKEVHHLKEQENNYKIEVFSLTQKVNILKAASGIMTELDQREFEKRIDQYIKEIDKCIGMLSE